MTISDDDPSTWQSVILAIGLLIMFAALWITGFIAGGAYEADRTGNLIPFTSTAAIPRPMPECPAIHWQIHWDESRRCVDAWSTTSAAFDWGQGSAQVIGLPTCTEWYPDIGVTWKEP